MSFAAIIPVANLASANASLEAQGFGPNNFSIPAYVGAGAQFAALHSWDIPAFVAAVKALPGVVWSEGTGNPCDQVTALITGQSAKWNGSAAELPSAGLVQAGDLYLYAEEDGTETTWSVIQQFNRSVFGEHPDTYPALIRRVRNPKTVEPWRQPIDQYDAYKLVNPFTGEADKCTHNGSTWRVTQADGSGNNVWEPGVFGWVQE